MNGEKKQLQAIPNKGQYELSLAEFPITLLSRTSSQRKYIEYRDFIMGKNGKKVERVWKVYPDGKWGFGGASTLSTLYELFQVWKDHEFNSKTITFGSLYSLAKRKGIVPTNTSYKTLRKDLRCLVGIVIEAKNAFWDNEKQAYVDAEFHLFEKVAFFKETPKGQATLPFCYIQASDELFASILSNSLMVTEFDSEFFHSLRPTEQRLALYLSKMLRNCSVHKRDLVKLAEQLPLTTKTRKKAKQQIKQAAERLIEKNFKLLKAFRFEKNSSNDGENIIFYKTAKAAISENGTFSPKPKRKSERQQESPNADYVQVCLIEDILSVCRDEQSKKFYAKVAAKVPQDVIYRALAEVKEVRNCGEIKRNEGALFTSLIKKYAKERNISL